MSPRDPTEQLAKIKAVLEVTKAYRTIIHIDVLLSTIVSTAAETVGAEAGSILLYDDDGKLRFQTASGIAAGAVKPMSVAPGQGIAGWTAQTGKAAIVNDVESDPRFERRFDRESGFRTRSILCVPLIFDSKVIGVIELLNKNDGGEFDAEDESLLGGLADQAAISIEHVRLADARNNYFTHVIEILIGVMDTHISIKTGHARRVARYTKLMAQGLGLGEAEQKDLYFAGLLHDIGLLKLDTEGELTRERIELHPVLGYEMIKDIIVWKEIAPIILHHHERWDGRGYPERLEGEAIPIGARIVSVAETFDVLTSKNSYRTPRPYDVAVREIEAHAGTQFDPHVVEVFKTSISESELVDSSGASGQTDE